ncbi:MAG TPA: hypothetical protein GXZ59_08160 [Clostridiaceae bacterium]|nr:hypothetical protein [Clostridiaceae bacterium]
MTQIIDLMKSRYSERRFDPDKSVEEAKISQLLEAARIAPTASNRQAFRIYLLEGERGKEIMSNFNAPMHIVLTQVEEEAWQRREDCFNAAALDIGIIGAHIVLAAEELGLKTCLICAFNVAELTKNLSLPPEEYPILAVAIGYASSTSAPGPRHTARKPLTDLLRPIPCD